MVHCLTCFNQGSLDISTKQNRSPKILGLATIKAYILLRLWFNVSWFVGEESGPYCLSAKTLWALSHTLWALCLIVDSVKYEKFLQVAAHLQHTPCSSPLHSPWGSLTSMIPQELCEELTQC